MKEKIQKNSRFSSICKAISSGRNFLIVCHRNPDGDCVGSALALWHILRTMRKKPTVWIPEGVPGYLSFLKGANSVKKVIPEDARFDFTIAVDTASESILEKPLPPASVRGKVIVIDHHTIHSRWGDIYYYEKCSAVGEIILALIMKLGVNLTKTIAECLYVSIVTDTGSFRYDNTTAEVMRASARLLEAGVNPWKINKLVYESYPERRIFLLVDVLSTLKVDLGGKFATIEAPLEFLRKHKLGPDALEDFVNYPRGIRGVEVAALLREREDGSVRVSLRSTGKVNVAKIAYNFGGGGHRAAGGCTFEPPETIDGARQKLKDYLEVYFDKRGKSFLHD